MQAYDQLAPAGRADLQSNHRYLWVVVAGLLAVHATAAWLTRAAGIGIGQDDATYVLLSRSLAHGEYRDLFLVGAPPHRLYPPGYPALLAVWQAIAGDRFDGLVVLSIVCSTVTLALTFALLRRLFSTSTAVICLVALAVNPYLVDSAGRVGSEAPYALFSLLALWIVMRAGAPSGMVYLAGASAIAAALTRSIGITLLVALSLYWILQRRIRWAATLTMSCVLTVGIGLWRSGTITARGPMSYLADATFADRGVPYSLVQELVYRIVHNVPAYLGLALPYLLPLPTVQGTVVDNVLGTALATAGLAAGIAVFARRWRPAALYLLAYAALLTLWPWQVSRYIVPVLCLVVPAVLIGSGWLTQRFGANWESRTVLALGSVLAINGAVRTARMIQIRASCVRGATLPSPSCVHPYQASFFAAVDYIGKYTAPDAVFVSAKAPTLFYYTGRRSILPDATPDHDPGSFVRRLARNGVEYVLLSTLLATEPRRAEMLSADCQALSLVVGFPPSTYLFRIRSAADRSDEAACRALVDYHRATIGEDFNLRTWPP